MAGKEKEKEVVEKSVEKTEGKPVAKSSKKSKSKFVIRHSIRTKLIAIISVLVVVIMVSTAWFLMAQKRQELTRDIYVNARSFAELTAGDISEGYETYLAENGFIQFNRMIQNLFRKSEDVSRITLVRFGGEVLYDSETEKLEQYHGDLRTFAGTEVSEGENEIIERIQSPFPSVNISGDGRVVYLEKDPLGLTFEVNLNGKKVEPIKDEDRVGTMVQPVSQKYAVLYQVSYDLLDARIAKTYRQIGLMLLVGIAFGIFLAIIVGQKATRPIKSLVSGAAEIAEGHFDYRVHIHSQDELGLLSNAFNKMAVDLKKSTKALVYKERVAKELELAKGIQESLIPKEVPEIEGLDIAASVTPAAEIGGDCYDFIKLDEDKTLMYLGDVTGHGVPAGLLVSVANAIIYAYSHLKEIMQIMVKTNAILQAKSQANMFITLAMLSWNGKTKKMDYVSAGHEKILHYNAKKKAITELESGGIALGMVPDCSKLLKKHPIDLNKGDTIIIYSDGIPEAWGKKKEQYGMGRLRRILMDTAAHADLPAEKIREKIITDLEAFMGSTEQADDITLMVVKKV